MRAVTVATVAALSIADRAAAEVCIQVDVRVASATPSTALLRTMTGEAAAIWKPYGVGIQWPGAVDTVQCASTTGSFDVHVSDEPRRHSIARPLALGTTRVGPSATKEPIYIDYAATKRLLESLKLYQLDQVLGRRELTAPDVGRALGRVLAHEIGHALLGMTGHEARGLMRATFLASELVGYRRRGYTLSDSEVARLRERERADLRP